MAIGNQAGTGRTTENAERIRVLIADDHALVRQGLRALLVDAGDLEVVGEARDGREAVAAAERLSPDVVLMDVLMPVMDGAEATAAIRAARSEVRILALSGSEIEARILATLRAGALGYVSKDSPGEELVAAIRRVHCGLPSIPPEMTRRLLERFEPSAPGLELLTPREAEILQLVAKGLSNLEIAGRVSLSEGTVRTHLTRIFAKLGVHNRVEATLCALRDGLATLAECLEPAV